MVSQRRGFKLLLTENLLLTLSLQLMKIRNGKRKSFKPKKKMTSKVKKTKSKTPSLNSGYEIMEEHKELISNFSEKENMKKVKWFS